MILNELYDLTAIGTKDASIRMLGAVQSERPEAVVAAIATLFLGICRRFRLDPRCVLDITDRVMRDAEDQHPVEMRAFHRYLREEIND